MIGILKYDGTFEGFLSCVFYAYEHKLDLVSIEKIDSQKPSLFESSVEVISESQKAKRVWKGLSKKMSAKGKKKLYKAFLSEVTNIENALYYYIRRAMTSNVNIESDFTDPKILHIEKVVKKVDREKHRMDAFVRFRLTQDGIYFATVEPDFDVLPLVADHFKSRYADQKWIIYDLKRKYGIYYNLDDVQTVSLEISKDINSQRNASSYFTIEEMQFQRLWANYFKSSNIASRKNMQLHIKHIPKRYWKYLSEKNF